MPEAAPSGLAQPPRRERLRGTGERADDDTGSGNLRSDGGAAQIPWAVAVAVASTRRACSYAFTLE